MPTIALLSTHMHWNPCFHLSILSNAVKKVDVSVKSHKISWEPNLWSFWMAGRQSPGATCLSNVRRGQMMEGPAFAANLHCIWVPNFETGRHGLEKSNVVACGCHTTDYQGTLLNISHNTFFESEFLVSSSDLQDKSPTTSNNLNNNLNQTNS